MKSLQPSSTLFPLFHYFNISSTLKEKNSHIVLSPSLIHLISGGIAGGISRTLTAPLDRIRILLQTRSYPASSGAYQIVLQIIRQEGLPGFFQGNLANCIKIIPELSLKLFLYDLFKRRVIYFHQRAAPINEHHDLSNSLETEDAVHIVFREKLLLAALAGVCAQTAIYPMEVIRTRIAAAHPRAFSSYFDCLFKTLKVGGPAALFQGFVPTIVGIIPYAGLDLSCFETLKNYWKCTYQVTSTSDLPVHIILLSGGISSALGQTVAYPFTFARTRLQTDGMYGQLRRYKGVWEVFTSIIKTEGYFALRRGYYLNMLKTVPSISISWFVYESCKKCLHDLSY